MDSVSRVMDMMENLPDPLVYSIIALFTTGAVYSLIHHAKNWRPRKAKRVKLKGADGKKIEDCTRSLQQEKLTICSIDILESWSACTKHKL
jgi:hypothetical protein